jgi:hypothetical protein
MKEEKIKEIFKMIDRNLKEDIKFCEDSCFHNKDDFCIAGYVWLTRQLYLLKKLAKRFGVEL